MIGRYLRVSTDRQSTENQEPDLARIILAREGEPFVTPMVTYRETVSATAKNRPEFERMMEQARRGGLTRLYIWSIDRFGRRLFDNVRDLQKLADWGVEVISARESWLDTSNPLVRKLLIAILSWVAEYEHEKLKERTRAGLDRARAKGTRLGRKPVTVPPGVLSAALMRRKDGASWRMIARDLKALGMGTWTPATLHKVCHKTVADLPRGNRTGARNSHGEYS